MEIEKSLQEAAGRVFSDRSQIVRGATSIGIGVGSAGLVAGALFGSPTEGVLGTVLIVGSAGVRRVIKRRLQK